MSISECEFAAVVDLNAERGGTVRDEQFVPIRHCDIKAWLATRHRVAHGRFDVHGERHGPYKSHNRAVALPVPNTKLLEVLPDGTEIEWR